MKLTIETLKQLIKEELQYIQEAPERVKHSYREEFADVDGWDKENHQKLYQVFTKQMVPKNLKIVEVCAKALSHLYGAKQIHFTKWEIGRHKIFETDDCNNRQAFKPNESEEFIQRFELYSSHLGIDAFVDKFDASSPKLTISFDGEDADIMAADMNFPADKAPNIPELSNFYLYGDDWAYEAYPALIGAPTPSSTIPLVHENKPVKNCANKPLGIKLNYTNIKMKTEPEYVPGDEKVLMRATNSVETLVLELHIVEI